MTPQAMLQLAGMSKKLQRHIAAAAKVDDFKELVAVDTNLDEIKRRLNVWADIEEVPALQVDMAIDKDPKLRIGVAMEESKTAPGTLHQVARPEEPIISRMLDELSAYIEIKHGRAPAAGDPKSEMFLQGVEFMRSSFQD